MMGKKTEKVTDSDVRSAQEALTVGRGELVRLREAFLNGDGTEWSAVKSQEAVVEFAEAQIEKLARAQARYQESLRQSELGQIRAEMDAYATSEGEHFVGLLKAVESAATAFASAYVGHNRTVSGWRERMAANGVKPIGNRLSAASDAQGLSYADNGAVRAGKREFRQEYSGQVLQELLLALRGTFGPRYFESEQVGHPSLDELYARVGAPGLEAPGIPEGAVFYRHANGSVHMRDHEVPSEDLRRLQLKPISREEALGA